MFDKAEVKNDMTKLEQKFCYRFAIILIETMMRNHVNCIFNWYMISLNHILLLSSIIFQQFNNFSNAKIFVIRG